MDMIDTKRFIAAMTMAVLTLAGCGKSAPVAVESVSLDKTQVTLEKGASQALVATVLPANAADKSMSWSSSDEGVVTVDQEGTLTGIAYGKATVTVTTTDGELTASCDVTVKATLAAVDLGLSVKWASYNVGASGPEEYGDYFAWGETDVKSVYDKPSYTMTENINTLTSGCDVAAVRMGGSWRMPTDAEWSKLRSECDWQWTTVDGVDGYKVSGTVEGYTDNWIFLPAAGYKKDSSLEEAGTSGRYWSSGLCTLDKSKSYYTTFTSSGRSGNRCDRFLGLTVRAVTE